VTQLLSEGLQVRANSRMASSTRAIMCNDDDNVQQRTRSIRTTALTLGAVRWSVDRCRSSWL